MVGPVIRLPLWAIFSVAFGSPLLAFIGVLFSQVVNRRGAHELESRSKREETMRNLRWSSELAVNQDDRMANLGVAQLAALLPRTCSMTQKRSSSKLPWTPFTRTRRRSSTPWVQTRRSSSSRLRTMRDLPAK